MVRDRGDRARTCDLRFWRPTLYQLSYAPRPDEFTGRCAGRLERRQGAVALLDDQAVELESARAALVTSAVRPRDEGKGVAPARAPAELRPEETRHTGGRFDASRSTSILTPRASSRRSHRRRERLLRVGAPVSRLRGRTRGRRALRGRTSKRQRVIGGDQGAGTPGRLNHDRDLRQGCDDPVAHREPPRGRLDAWPPLRDDGFTGTSVRLG